MQKFYEIKTYDWKGVFKKQINNKNITSDFSFSENINGVQGDINIDIIGDNTDFLETDIVEIREINSDTPISRITVDNTYITVDNDIITIDNVGEYNVFPTYTGIIERKGIKEYKYNQVVSLSILGVGTVLNDVLYKDGTSRVFVKTDTPGNIAKNIIDYFNSQYGNITQTQNLTTSILYYDLDSIDITGDVVQFEFSENNCFESLEKLTQDTDFYFFVDSTGKVTFKTIGETKILTFDREIISIERKTKKDDMINRFFLSRVGGIEKPYNNTASQSSFALKEKSESREDIQDETTQDIIGNTRVSDFGEPRIETTIKIKPQKGDFLFPGMQVTTMNTNMPLIDAQITKIDKRSDEWNLYIGDYTSFGKSFLQR